MSKLRKPKILVILLLIATFPKSVNASDSTQVYPTFCGIQLSIPIDCKFEETEISNDLEFVQWFIDSKKLPDVRDQLPTLFLNELQKMLNNRFDKVRQTSITVICLNEELKGHLFKVEKDKDLRYYMFISGKVNSEYVRIYACTLKNPNKRKNIPDFIGQIFYII